MNPPRLNTGGAALTEQEVRNSIAVSINSTFYNWLVERSNEPNFVKVIAQTQTAMDAQIGIELALRFFAFRTVEYQSGLDIHEYLDRALLKIATDSNFNMSAEGHIFTNTFQVLDQALGDHAFKRWTGKAFQGKFLLSVFEVMATGVSHNLGPLTTMDENARNDFIITKAKLLWQNQAFTDNSGAGVRGTTRLSKLLPLARNWLNPNI